jgi:heme-degrading monooxygenase HmoA
LAHAVDDQDAGYTLSLWENEAAMRTYENSAILQKTIAAPETFSSRAITLQRAVRSGLLKNLIK